MGRPSNEVVTPAWRGDRRGAGNRQCANDCPGWRRLRGRRRQWERNLHPELLDLKFPYNDAFDPIVATHPTNSDRIAVSYHYQPPSGSHCGIIPGLRLSADGGATWHEAGRRPWAGSGRYPNWHATIAWGPGPTPGSGRLYWADTTVSSCQFADHRLSVAYSDDLGQSWSTTIRLWRRTGYVSGRLSRYHGRSRPGQPQLWRGLRRHQLVRLIVGRAGLPGHRIFGRGALDRARDPIAPDSRRLPVQPSHRVSAKQCP